MAYAVLVERKVSAWIQDRVGPNRTAPPFVKYIPVVGPFLTRLGFFQPLADGLKFLVKEDFTPAGVKKIYFWLAPAIAMIPAMLTLAVIPFGSQLGAAENGHRGFERRHSLHVRHCFHGRLWHCAGRLCGELKVSVFWRHPFERADDFVRNFDGHVGHSGFLIAGNLNLSQIIGWQATHGWLVIYAPLSFIIFMVASLRKPTARRSICRKRKPNWSAATTRNTAR